MEIHLVYYDTNFGTYNKAIDSNIGLCVLSLIGEVIYMNIFIILDFRYRLRLLKVI